MLKCPFCGFQNEEGSLFCEQCKSDLSTVAATPSAPIAPPPMASFAPSAEVLPMAPVVEAHIPMGQILEAAPVAVMATASAAVPAAVVPDVIPFAPGVMESPPAGIPLGEMPQVVIPTGATVPEAQVGTPVVASAPFVPAAVIPPQPPISASVPSAASAPATPAIPSAAKGAIPAGATPKLAVRRGQRVGVEYNIYPDYNYIGRADEKPVDIDLEDQEPPDRVWCSRQHAVIHLDDVAGTMTIEDLNSSNGTYVNRNKVYPGSKQPLQVGDVIQIGNIHMIVKL